MSLDKNVDFTDMLEFNCQNKNNVFHYTNVVWVREYPNGERIRSSTSRQTDAC